MFLLALQLATAQSVATCRVPSDPQQRVWSLERVSSSWRIAFSAKFLDRPHVTLPVPHPPSPVDPSGNITLDYSSGNGGRRIEWQIKNDGASTLDLHVNHGLEVNVERDLDPAVELMNTDGPIDVMCSPGDGQTLEVRSAPQPSRTEWTAAVGMARSVRLFASRAGRDYAVQTISLSRELTGDLNFVGVRGRFAWGIEAMPLFAQLSPRVMYGVGLAPVVWRWNFPPQQTWSSFAEMSVGGLWTSDPIPENTSYLNFTAHWGGGIRRRLRGNDALLLAYRFQHFSNGNQLRSNPGVNSHVVLGGWSHR